MKLQQVSDNCFAVLNEKNRVCDANSGLINRAGGIVIDTQSDLAHAHGTPSSSPRPRGRGAVIYGQTFSLSYPGH